MKKTKWFILCISSVFLILSLLSSCSPKFVYDEEAFLKEAKDVLTRASTVNTVWFTQEGIPAKKNGVEAGNYKEIDNSALQSMGFDSLQEIKEETQLLFNAGTYIYIMSLVFEPQSYEGNGAIKRYIVTGEGTEDEMIMRDTSSREYLSDVVTFDTSTVTVVSHGEVNGSYVVTVTVDVTVTNEDGKQENRPAEAFKFICEDGKWKLLELICIPYGNET